MSKVLFLQMSWYIRFQTWLFIICMFILSIEYWKLNFCMFVDVNSYQKIYTVQWSKMFAVLFNFYKLSSTPSLDFLSDQKYRKKICAPLVKDIFRIWNFYKLSSTPSLNLLSDCATQLFGTEIMPSPRWKWKSNLWIIFREIWSQSGPSRYKKRWTLNTC